MGLDTRAVEVVAGIVVWTGFGTKAITSGFNATLATSVEVFLALISFASSFEVDRIAGNLSFGTNGCAVATERVLSFDALLLKTVVEVTVWTTGLLKIGAFC